jgi:hypothetical protein
MQFDAFTKRNIFYVTRQKENANYTSIEEFALNTKRNVRFQRCCHSGIMFLQSFL